MRAQELELTMERPYSVDHSSCQGSCLPVKHHSFGEHSLEPFTFIAAKFILPYCLEALSC